MTSPGEETEAGCGLERVKETSFMTETDCREEFQVKHFIPCEMRE
jgi:hypothetical protein